MQGDEQSISEQVVLTLRPDLGLFRIETSTVNQGSKLHLRGRWRGLARSPQAYWLEVIYVVDVAVELTTSPPSLQRFGLTEHQVAAHMFTVWH